MKYDLTYQYKDFGSFKTHSFFCMGGLCEVLIETTDPLVSDKIFSDVYHEAKRLEKKYSRYRDDNIVYQINNALGKSVKIDNESYRLLSFADSLYHASHGLFDITSGVLRRAWTFDQSENIPGQDQIDDLLKLIGWSQVKLTKDKVQIPKGWQLDFGGVGKEYAVDSCCQKAKALGLAPTLVNLGGDISVTGPKLNHQAWQIRIEDSDEIIMLYEGSVATSGDKNKFLIKDGRKLPHILNPKTGWPIEGAPHSVTVIASNCTEAGALATLALLQGPQAEGFLKAEANDFRVFHKL